MKSIILLHGALGAKVQLETLKNLLSKNFNVHTLDFEGHGDRISNQDYSIDLFAQNLKEYLDHNISEKCVIFGYSMGGYVALKLAKSYPDYFHSIITLATKFHWSSDVAEKEIRLLDPKKIEEKVPAFAQSLSQIHTATNWQVVMQKTARMMFELGNGKALIDDDFKIIQTKCFIGLGDNDSMVTQEETSRVASIIPQAEFYLLENTIHPIDKLDFAKVAKLILEKSGRI